MIEDIVYQREKEEEELQRKFRIKEFKPKLKEWGIFGLNNPIKYQMYSELIMMLRSMIIKLKFGNIKI